MSWYLVLIFGVFALSTVNVFYWALQLRHLDFAGDLKIRRRAIGNTFVSMGVWDISIAAVLILSQGWVNAISLIGMGLLMIFLGRHPRVLGH